MHWSLSDVEETISSGGVTIRQVPAGDLRLSVERYERDLDTAPLFEGLPGGRCSSPHWGYMISGRAHVEYESDSETVSAGELFYIDAGHTLEIEAGTEYVTFNPAEEFRATMAVVAENFERLRE